MIDEMTKAAHGPARQKTIGLIRHGETDWNIQRRMQGQENLPLNARGQQQSAELAQLIAQSGWTWQTLVSSPLQRALDTAQAISQTLNSMPIRVLDQLIERDFGGASDLTRSEAKVKFPDGNIPGLEKQEDLTKRVLSGLRVLFTDYSEDHILLVTHGEVMRTIYRIIGQDHKVALKPGNASLDVITLQWDQVNRLLRA